MTDGQSYSIIKTVTWNVLVAVLMVAAAATDIVFRIENLNASPIWAPTGVALAIVLLSGFRMLPGLFLGSLAANIFWFVEEVQQQEEVYL